MTDLLVGSLMADGGLEATLDASIKIEMRDIEEKMIEGTKAKLVATIRMNRVQQRTALTTLRMNLVQQRLA